MQIKSITVQGFRSFAAQQEVDFTKLKPGLYHLSGKNEVEPALEGNGAGKSSLLEAICWALYGRTSRNLRAGSVKNWGGKEKCGAIIELTSAAGDLGIFRTWNPNTLELSRDGTEPRPIEQKELDALLGMSPEAYLFAVYFAQFAPAFIDLKPAEQMSVYSTVMGLDLWERAADAAGKRGRELEGAVQRYKEAVARLEGEEAQATATLTALDDEERAWIEGMAAKEEQFTATLKAAQANLKKAEAARTKAAAGSAEFRRLRDEAEAEARKLAVAEAAVRAAEREVAALSGKEKVTKCPACGGPISTEHLKKERASKQAELKEAKHDSDAILDTHNAKLKEMVKFRDAEVALLEAEKQVAACGAEARSAQSALTALAEEENPYDKKRSDAAACVETLRGRVAKGKLEVEKAEAERGSSQFWAKGFKELRLSLIEESLAQLSIEANSALVELGLRDWALGFDVERETKSGSVSKGFTVSVQAPHTKEPVPWECWSGGESQRLRVAASLGFGELICSRMGVAPNLELWDEPSTWLSEAGIYDLLASLAERAKRRSKVIILADHRALDFGGFTGNIHVVKTKAGSTITVA